jgi:alpha-glucosidase
MPWTRDGASFGFSPSGASWLPMPAHWGALSVEAQTGDPDSTLELTRRMLRLRRAEPALGDGDLHWVSEQGDACLVLRRPAADEDPHVLVAMNLGDSPALVQATEVLACSGAAPEPGDGGFWVAPDTAAWLR